MLWYVIRKQCYICPNSCQYSLGLSRIMLKIVVLVIGVGDQNKRKAECIAIPFAIK